ncbi:DUF6711 family protein [Velocimicrobium porci]|uniref:Uncharacterized protein n=1 Tax=Velocimicrobium porci TaxID=2606634 RepID=A0A6L5Y0E6_9FIRM|nr:DUF6711 family protein [Velocimicrobium porci]MSS64606.1 hypothetical protein [Velocimicrobium porci]DAN97718.1 MAG TPA: hypothetical protein [Caudoviricetes sp.]
MADYKGYLMKVEGIGIVPSYLFTAYESNPNQETDLNSYTDGNGLTHRNVLPHTKSTIKFTTHPRMTLDEKIKLQKYFPNRKKVVVEYWNDEYNKYTTGNFYITPVTFPVKDYDKETIYYDSITYELIEY